MAKLATLRLIEGSVEEGIRVMLTISKDGSTEPDIYFELPGHTELANNINEWESNYGGLTGETRMQIGFQPLNETNLIRIQQDGLRNLRDLEQVLGSQIKTWMESNRKIHKAFLTKLMNEEVRILVHSEHRSLLKIPWHLWDFIYEDNKQAEVALSFEDRETLGFEAQLMSNTTTSLGKVRILAIMGNNKGIDTEHDEELIRNLPNADPVFLREEEWSTIHDHLCDQNWDILFFAGHSYVENGQSRFCINRNRNDDPTIDDFRGAIGKAVENGLQLAIFNSCDGLGLGFDLQKLHLPHSIVMRYPIPDKIAQKFLSYFLDDFAKGQSLYLAEKNARRRLERFGNDFPGASWLPVIVQSPSAHRHSLTWKDLRGGNFHRRRWLPLFLILISALGSAWFLIPKLIRDKPATLLRVECTSNSNGQECDRTGDYTFEADGYSFYEFNIEASKRCSKVMHSLEWKDSGEGKKYTRFLGSGERDTITPDHKFSRGTQVVKIGGIGKEGGCNSGKLGKWATIITISPRSKNPRNIEDDIDIALGNAYFASGKNEEALDSFSQVIARNPRLSDKAQVYHSLGNIYNKIEQYLKARENWQKSLELYNQTGDENNSQKVRKEIAKVDKILSPKKD